jgi:hypothetical protein
MIQSKFAATAIALATGLALSGAAHSAITLKTTGVDAQSVFTFSTVAVGQMGLVSVSVSAPEVSNTTLASTTPTVDPETGLTVDVKAFNFPVTKAQVKIGWGLKIAPVAGDSMRSALLFTRPAGRGQPPYKVGLGNFRIDYPNQIMRADIMTSTGTTTNVPLYNFTDNKDTQIKLVGLGVVMTGSFKDMIFDDAAADKIGDGLNINPVLRPPLKQAQWGGVAIRVNVLKKRPGGAISDKAITAADLGI